MKSIQEFEQLFESELKPKLEPIELERKKFVTKCRWIFFGTIAMWFIRYWVIVLFDIETSMVIGNEVYAGINIACFLATLLLLIIFIIFLTRFKNRFVARYKVEIINEIVAFIDGGLSYAPQSGISDSLFRYCDIFLHDHDRFYSEDYVYGTIDKTQIEFSEIHAEYKTESTNDKGETTTRWHTIFRGLFFAADFNKEFLARTVVLPDNFGSMFGFIGQKLQSINPTRDSLVKLEDPEFEKYFVVYGSDQVEARYILSPSLMARITDFRKKTDTKFSLSFVGNRLHMAIPLRKNLFEPNLFSTNMKFSLLSTYFNYLILLVGIAEDLNLNNRIWTKQ